MQRPERKRYPNSDKHADTRQASRGEKNNGVGAANAVRGKQLKTTGEEERARLSLDVESLQKTYRRKEGPLEAVCRRGKRRKRAQGQRHRSNQAGGGFVRVNVKSVWFWRGEKRKRLARDTGCDMEKPPVSKPTTSTAG